MAKRRRPEKAPEGLIYLIRHSGTDIHKIGITLDWSRRAKQLEVGSKVQPVAVVRVLNPHKLEQSLHAQFSAQRVPQSEWFHLDVDQLEQVLQRFKEAEQRYKDWVQRLQAPKPPATREPMPYRMVGPTSRLTSSAVHQVAAQPAPPKPASPLRPTEKATPSRNTVASQSISWGSAFFLGLIISVCFPLIGFILVGFGFSSSAGKSLFLGVAIQSALIAYWTKKGES